MLSSSACLHLTLDVVGGRAGKGDAMESGREVPAGATFSTTTSGSRARHLGLVSINRRLGRSTEPTPHALDPRLWKELAPELGAHR